MKNAKALKFQKYIDKVIDKVFLRFIPNSIKPNQVTFVRFLLIPIVYLLLESNNLLLALIVFVIAASTDFIDGAMARTRGQITDIGKIIDPVADKLLIMSVLLYIGFKYLIVKIFIVFIILELFAVIFGASLPFLFGKPIGANMFGKIKMVLQSFSVGLFILGLSIKNSALVGLSEILLIFALFFAILAGLENLKLKVICKK